MLGGASLFYVMPDQIGHLIPVDSEREPRPAKKNGPNPVA